MTSSKSSPTSCQELLGNRILVVDDAAINRELISGYLKSAGYRCVETAVDGEDALKKMADNETDLLILDLVMPKLNGTQVIQELRSHTKTKQLPILVQTIISDPEQRSDAWNFGATDVITKPINKLELLSRVKVQLENSFLIKELENYHTITNQEISRALDLQKSLLPTELELKNLVKQYAVKIDSIYLPCRYLSGDLWGMFELSPTESIIWLADYSGKGISASLSTLRLHTLITDYKNKTTSLEELATVINSRLVDMIPIGEFCTILIGKIDSTTSTFKYVSASATHPIIYDRDTKEYCVGDGTGMPLGITTETSYHAREMMFKPGQSLILYSDLLWEDQGGIPGISLLPEDLEETMKQLQGGSIIDLVRKKLSTLDDMQFSDDLTLVEIQR